MMVIKLKTPLIFFCGKPLSISPYQFALFSNAQMFLTHTSLNVNWGSCIFSNFQIKLWMMLSNRPPIDKFLNKLPSSFYPAGHANGTVHVLQHIRKKLSWTISLPLMRRHRSCQILIGQKNSTSSHQHTSNWEGSPYRT